MVMNFSRPAGGKPAMLSWDETTTYFHEFGHALHNFFAAGKYRRTARSVPRDFVELPSQILENWAGVLDADAFMAFKDSGDLFNRELAGSFRKYILAENNLWEGMDAYVRFRGHEPSIEPFLIQKGLLE